MSCQMSATSPLLLPLTVAFTFTVSLTKVSANRPEAKTRLVENLQQAADKYDRAMIVRFDNMRTSALKELRASMPDSRLFMGKNRVMQVALCGGELSGEFRPGLSEFADDISGQVAVLFTNRTAEEVLDAFAMSEVPDFARAGTRASQTVVIPAGPLPTMPFTQVDTLNSLGMATSLQRGIVVSAGDHTVCEEGQVLSPEASRLLVCEIEAMSPRFVALHLACARVSCVHLALVCCVPATVSSQKLFDKRTAVFKPEITTVWDRESGKVTSI